MTLPAVVAALRRFYGRLPEPPDDPFGYFVWEVLSAGTAPPRRDAAFGALKKIPALTPDAMRRAAPAKIEAAVALAGSYREQRLEALHNGIDRFKRMPGLANAIRGPLPRARRVLRAFPNLGEAGSHRMLLFAGHHQILPVDDRVERVATRLGYCAPTPGPGQSARAIRRALEHEMGDLDSLRRLFLYLAHHGSVTCTQHDPHCSVCPIAEDCSFRREHRGVNSSRQGGGEAS